MSESLIISKGNRSEKYNLLIPQIESLVNAETDVVACMANVSSAIKYTFDFYWIGFYRVCGNDLVLGPFQGPLACTRIKKGRGVCGAAWDRNECIIVDDVDLFPGHIACSSESRCEIVCPICKDGEVVGVIDIDSDKLKDFSDVDRQNIQHISAIISQRF